MIKSTIITVETKIHDMDGLYQQLQEFSNFYCHLERKLFNDLANADKINMTLRKNLKRQYISDHRIHARLFNALWVSVKGKLDGLKQLDTENKKDIKRKISKVNQRIKKIAKWLQQNHIQIKGKKQTLNCFDRNKYKKNLRLYKEKIQRLQAKVDKEFKPSMVFGSRGFYKKQWTDEQYTGHDKWLKEWRRRRNNHFSFIGSKDESNGNQLCQFIADNNIFKVRLPYFFEQDFISIPVKFSSDDKTNKQYYSYFHQAYQNSQALSYKFLQRDNGHWYVQASFEVATDTKPNHVGCIGIDINADLIATSIVNHHGNFVRLKNYRFNSESFTAKQAENTMSDIVNQIVKHAKATRYNISIEDLNLKTCKTGKNKKTNRKVSLMQYSMFRQKLETKCIKEGIWLKIINPAFTSVIGKYKYAKYHGISVHNSAAIVIARRGMCFKDRIPRQISYVLHRGEENEFFGIHRHKHHWSSWNFVRKNLVKCLRKLNSIYRGTLGSAKWKAVTVNMLLPRSNPDSYVVQNQVL